MYSKKEVVYLFYISLVSEEDEFDSDDLFGSVKNGICKGNAKRTSYLAKRTCLT